MTRCVCSSASVRHGNTHSVSAARVAGPVEAPVKHVHTHGSEQWVVGAAATAAADWGYHHVTSGGLFNINTDLHIKILM